MRVVRTHGETGRRIVALDPTDTNARTVWQFAISDGLDQYNDQNQQVIRVQPDGLINDPRGYVEYTYEQLKAKLQDNGKAA